MIEREKGWWQQRIDTESDDALIAAGPLPDPARVVMDGLRAKLDAAALEALKDGKDWAEGPVTFGRGDALEYGTVHWRDDGKEAISAR